MKVTVSVTDHLVAVVLWLGYQGWLNLHRYSAIASNLSTLIGELDIGGEANSGRASSTCSTSTM